ncbi:MAG: prepilin-type N-terminal cleavage/methylation domain-containing protein [Proteobacteria bacterium]|nr:prepilin-type N-terminal cleavage/methylation domain-containing protein [Pseudomonadota bacterium]
MARRIEAGNAPRCGGFTLIELIVVLTIIGTLLAIAVPRYFSSLEKSRETILRQDLSVMRDALDKYDADKGHFPETLEGLVTDKYLRSIPVDPYTKKADTWVVVQSDDVDSPGVKDVHSGAEGSAPDGSAYASW